MLVSNNADVCQTTEEHERSKLELLIYRRGLKARKQVTGARSLEADASGLVNGPDKSRAIEAIWTSRAPAIRRAESLVDCRHQLRFIFKKPGARRRRRRRKVDSWLWFSFPGWF